MKKFLALGLLSVSLASAKVFVGVDGGYNMVGFAAPGKVDSSAWHGDYKDSWSVSANVGYESLFNSHFGIRSFVSVGYGQFVENDPSNYNIKADLNLDALFNLINTGSFQAGLFAGVGAGYEYQSFQTGSNQSVSFGQIPIYGRAGLSFGLGESIRLDLTTRLPIVAWGIHHDDKILPPVPVYNTISYQVGLKFLF